MSSVMYQYANDIKEIKEELSSITTFPYLQWLRIRFLPRVLFMNNLSLIRFVDNDSCLK